MPISMLWSGLVRVRENDGRTNDDREKDVVPFVKKVVSFQNVAFLTLFHKLPFF